MEPLMGVGLVMALLFGTAWAASRRKSGWPLLGRAFRRSAPDRRMTLVERLPLTPNHALHLVELDGRRLLVATHPQGASIALGEEPGSFAGLFAQTAGAAAARLPGGTEER
jgi:flagellar biogenesis protein FliO